jgi:hypothetical protein
MRATPLLIAVVGVAAGCHIFSAALPCGDDDGCSAGEACVDGLCAAIDGAEGEAGEGEGEVVVGEGEGVVVAGEGEGEGEVVAGEGEGEAGEGEGEGEVVGEGEGEGEVVAGEGEGEGEGEPAGEGEGEPPDPPDPCPPLVDEQFDGVAQYLEVVEQGPGASISLTGGQARLSSGAQNNQPSFAAAEGPATDFDDLVIEIDLQIAGSVQDGESVGIQIGADDLDNDFDVDLDVVGDNLAFYALDGDGLLATVEQQFTPGTLNIQIRFDGPSPVAHINGAVFTLPSTVPSNAVDLHYFSIFTGCFAPPCDGVSLVVERLAIFGSCRP